MKHPLRLGNSVAAGLLCLSLTGCLGGGDNALLANTPGGSGTPTTPTENPNPTPVPVVLTANSANPDFAGATREFEAPACSKNADSPRAGGGTYSVNLQSASGYNIAFTVFEPASFNCKQGNPLVLHGHGYGGSRETTATGLLKRLVDAGAGVISIDQRGFGESGGTVRVMDPDFEGQDLLQILDWAETHLDWLRYANDKPVGNKKLNMVLGSTGGSYGGGYQLLINNIDPKQRLDAMTPDITWNDLRYSLNPGGAYGIKDFKPAEGEIAPLGTVKSGWALLLVAGGESGSLQPKLQAGQVQALQTSGQDMLIRETLLRGSLANRFPDGAKEFFRYHSPSYWCDAEVPGAQTFLQQTVTPGLAPKTPPAVDVLFTQGFRDTLFNFNDAWHNVQCYRKLKDSKGKAADVRLLTHQSGHILPLSPSMVPGLADLAAQGAQNGLNEIEFQRPAGPFACGALSIQDAQFAFLVEKLFTASEAQAIAKAANNKGFTELAANKGKICVSLTDDVGATEASPNAAVWVDENAFFAANGPAVKGGNTQSAIPPVNIDFTPGADPASVLLSSVGGLLRYPVAPAVFPIELPAGVNTLAGITTGSLEIAPPAAPLMNPACPQFNTAITTSPVGLLGLDPGCDPMLFIGLGVNRNGAWRLIDDQVTAIRGFGKRHVELNGVAERLADGEKLGLLVYGYHPQYLATGSRDLVSPVVALKGTLNLPILK
ncbi:MAG TPA: CocE/NonD family hydrolase [Limnobacter sp.]|uniref:alpha/beta hydrolase n=1 Tax=Limnobacter sp. TaxID=2003368 RepID=UPI002ED95C55